MSSRGQVVLMQSMFMGGITPWLLYQILGPFQTVDVISDTLFLGSSPNGSQQKPYCYAFLLRDSCI